MSRKRRVTIEQTTTTTVTAEETTTGPLPWAPGWDDTSPDVVTGHALRRQRTGQVTRCLEFLWDAAASADWESLQGGLPEIRRCATVILRAGPGATPFELEHGRSL